MTVVDEQPYAARLEIDYPEQLDRLTTFFRLISGEVARLAEALGMEPVAVAAAIQQGSGASFAMGLIDQLLVQTPATLVPLDQFAFLSAMLAFGPVAESALQSEITATATTEPGRP